MTSTIPPPGRAEIIDWLAGFGQRPPGTERLDSMELAWLAHQVEQRHLWTGVVDVGAVSSY
jgi:hypothetical protein